MRQVFSGNPSSCFDSSIHNIKAKIDSFDVSQVSFVLHYATETESKQRIKDLTNFMPISLQYPDLLL